MRERERKRSRPYPGISLDSNWFCVTADILRKLKFSRYQRCWERRRGCVPVRPVRLIPPDLTLLIDRPHLLFSSRRLSPGRTRLISTPFLFHPANRKDSFIRDLVPLSGWSIAPCDLQINVTNPRGFITRIIPWDASARAREIAASCGTFSSRRTAPSLKATTKPP